VLQDELPRMSEAAPDASPDLVPDLQSRSARNHRGDEATLDAARAAAAARPSAAASYATVAPMLSPAARAVVGVAVAGAEAGSGAPRERLACASSGSTAAQSFPRGTPAPGAAHAPQVTFKKGLFGSGPRVVAPRVSHA